MATSQVSVFREALRAAVDAGTSAAVFAYPPGDSNTTSVGQWIEFGTANSNQEHLAYGGSRAETISLDVYVYCRKSGAGQEQAKAAEDGALALFAEVEDAIRSDPDLSAVFHVQVTGPNEVQSFIDSANRICVIEGTVEAEAHI